VALLGCLKQGPGHWELLKTQRVCVQAQCILFRRYPEVLEPFKYAGYPMLLQAVALPQQEQADDPAAHFLAPQQAPRLQVTSCSCCTQLPAATTTGLGGFHQNVQNVLCVA